ncbi:DUF397 domain-containing protein [Streptomyces sp. NPDC003077]|uniref:DUF397 domain-containing protein n=1 Tax=Streptomyces sp. NPDC003077 TaxID=3154443 RepID=UPI0033A60C7C
MPGTAWQKSSYSSEASSCLEIAAAHDGLLCFRESDIPDVILVARPDVLKGLLATLKIDAVLP